MNNDKEASSEVHKQLDDLAARIDWDEYKNSGNKFACEQMVSDQEIDYNNPVWFMVNKKFSARAVAARVINSFAKQHHFIKTIKETKTIMIFNEGAYIPGEDEVEINIRDLLAHNGTTHFVNEVVNEIKMRTLTLLSDFNPEGYINLLNGVYMIDLKTFRFTEDGIYDEPKMLFTYKLQLSYDARATCPEIEKFFKWALPDELHREQVYEEFAYGFAPGYPIQKMFLWIGNGRNGKGVASTILRHIIGPKNICGWSVENLEKNTDYCQSNMVKKKWNICGDMPSKKVTLDFVKAATGGDIISVREIREQPFDTVNSCKLLFMMNNVFETTDFSDGATRRAIPTVWDVQVAEKDVDPHLSEKLTVPEELSGFFNLLMNSYDALMDRGHFIYNPTTDETEATLSELRGEDVQLFIGDTCVKGEGEKYARAAMYLHYKTWTELRKGVPKSKGNFNSFIKKLGYKSIKTHGVYVWTGVGKEETGPNSVQQNLAKSNTEIKVSS